ncbi:glycosyltransferase [Lacihabitans lacunae]|uniref:Glycosyltransferase n=1 Tax=Lacihabitans lacunae TaxID=1028214 RepID=A0ABV7YXK5_9BACT
MGVVLSAIFFGAVAVQLVYILFIFTKVIKHEDLETPSIQTKLPSVSVIIAASNELENLKELLPMLDQQDYPNFEILVSDDRSADGTYDFLLNNEAKIKHLNFLRIKDLPAHFTAKKYAVTMAVKKSKNDVLLFTDADCRPSSDLWIRNMVNQLTDDKDIVLGFSRYDLELGGLNALIRYETFQTALQYFSFALAKAPYMGVGRNLMYRKELFWNNNGFASHHGLLSGDDDLFVNQAANKNNVAISISEETVTNSVPKKTWDEWFVQKRRHLSVGKKYKLKDKVNLGLLWFSQLLTWFMFIPAFFIRADWFEAPEWSRIPNDFLKQYHLAHWYPFNDWMRLVLGVFVVWLLVKWLVLSKVNKKLLNTISNSKIPYHDFLYTVYLFVFGIITLFSNPKKIKWR